MISSHRIPSLDGLRALSISMVIIGHAWQGVATSLATNPFVQVLGNAGFGVEVFFVISGFLITTLLTGERDRSGSISLPRFYLRRAFRILPALWVFVLAVVALGAIGQVSGVNTCSVVSALTFATNYVPCADSEALIHTWSLSVEEQFYLFWPVAMVLAWRIGGRRAALAVAVTLILISPALRLLTFLFGGEAMASQIYYMLHTRLDALMFGCAAALAIGEPVFERAYRALAPAALTLLAVVMIASPLATQAWGGAYLYLFGYSIEGASIALAMVWVIRNPASIVGQGLNWRPVAYLGTISYSLYLWQTLFLKTDLGISRYTVAAVFASLIAAVASYHLVEKPFLWVRWRIELRPASARPTAPRRNSP